MADESQNQQQQGENQGQPQNQQQAQTVPYDRFQQVVTERNDWKRKHEELTAAQKTAGEQLAAAQKAVEEERSRLAAAELQSLRLRVAVENGLPMAFADRLQGGTAEELKADALKLAPHLKPTTPGVPPPVPGNPPPALDLSKMTPAQIREKESELWRQHVTGK